MPIAATVILCDAATVDPLQKVHMLGAGWSITVSRIQQHAVVVLLRVPWDRANEELPLELSLHGADGESVHGPDGAVLGTTRQNIEVGRPPGIRHGTDINFNFQLTLGPIELPPGRYEWRLEIAETTETASFQVMGPA